MATGINEKTTGRPRRDSCRQHFIFNNDDGYSYCKITGCSAKIKQNHCGNLEKHLRARHPEEYAALNQEKEASIVSKRQRSKSLSVSISIEDIQDALVELTMVNGRPFSLIDDSGFRKILEPLLKASSPDDTYTLSALHVRNLVELKAKDVRGAIREELKGKFLSLKVDAATRHDRGFLGINVQFIENGVIQIRTLGIIELTESHTAEYFQLVIQTVLNQYGIDIANIYSFTSDNGRNMVKLGRLLSEKQSSFDIDVAEEDEVEEDQDDNDDSIDEEQDSTEADELDASSIVEGAMPLDESEFCQLSSGTSLISSIRCAAHTLQLAIYDALKASQGFQTVIAKARMVAKALRKPKIRKMLLLSKPDAKKPPLDVVIRWNSTIDMLNYLVEMKNFCRDFSRTYKILHLTDPEWHYIEEYLKALQPSKTATIRLQAEQLTLSSFYGIWIGCKLVTSTIGTPLALEVVRAMQKREVQLLENDALLASVFLDPRFLSILPTEFHGRAISKLEQVWRKLEARDLASAPFQLDVPNRTMNRPSTMDTHTSQTDLSIDLLRKLCEEGDTSRVQRSQGTCNIRRLLAEYKETARLDVSADILQYWETKKNIMPQLYMLATVVHAAPATQVSVERLFSGMHFIFSTLRANLKSRILDDILIIRCNHQNAAKKLQKSNVSTRRQRRRTENETPSPGSSNASTPIDSDPVSNVTGIPNGSEESIQSVSREVVFSQF